MRACDTLERSGAAEHLNRVYASKHEAISSLFENLDKDVCARCTRRIFNECARAPMTPEKAAKVNLAHKGQWRRYIKSQTA
jgi:hypothetical protein